MGNSTYWEKKLSLIAFRQVLTKILPASLFIHLHNYDLFEKARLELSSLIQNCPAGLYPRIIRKLSPFLPKMLKNCCIHQVWTVTPSTETLWETLGMKENPTQQPKVYSFPPSKKFPLIDLHLLLSKGSFLPHQKAIFK